MDKQVIPKINKKDFEIGQVAYFVENDRNTPYKWHVAFGIVEEHYTYEIALQLYELADRRLINGIPVNDFETPTRWQKLPKGWTYTTELFELSHSEPPAGEYKINNPADILKAIEDGVLVKVQEVDHAHFEAEIDQKNGFRIVRKYPMFETWQYRYYVSVNYMELYHTYEEAQKVIDDRVAEFQRQAALSDYDWSVEQIDHSIEKAIRNGIITKEDGEIFRERLLQMDNVEDIETRVTNKGLEWKYWKNKRWNTMILQGK